jgi:hypothetical protein
MGKFIALAFVFGTAFISLFAFVGPQHNVAQSMPVVTQTATTPTIEQHVQTVCNQAVTEKFDASFEQYDLAVQYCVNALSNSYSLLGHWPGPEMNGNNSEAFFAANKAALSWGLLDVPYGYFASDGRDVIMHYMQIERETYGL